MSRLVAANIAERWAIRDDDVIVPITHVFGAHGQEARDGEAVFSFVAGSGAIWFAERVADWRHSHCH